MAHPSSLKSASFWRADWFVGVLVVSAVIVLHLTTDFIGTLERRFYDFASTSTARQPSDRIAVIAIDDQSIANLGRWPWSRDIHAQLIDQLAAAKARTIVHTAFFFEPQVDRGLSYIRKMKAVLASTADPAGAASAANEQLAGVIAEAEAALDTDGQLADSLRKAGNVILPSFYTLGEPQGKPDALLPAFALNSALNDQAGYSVAALRGNHLRQLSQPRAG